MKEFISCNQTELFADCDSDTIQNAISAAIEDGCRKVVIPRYNLRTDSTEWRISKTIEIPSEMTIILDNCYMVQETGMYDNMFRNSNALNEKHTLESQQHDINILGVGNVHLSGGEPNGLLERTARKWGNTIIWRNQMFYWVNVKNLRIENLFIERQRHWAITHISCEYVKIKNIDFYAIPHIPNMDGIDLRVGCHHFEMENITGKTGDDTIALTAVSGPIEVASLVEGRSSDIAHVKIKNVVSDPYRMLNVRLLAQDGHKVHDIDVDTIMDTSDWATKGKCHAALGIGTQGMLYVKVCRAKQEDITDVTAKHIYTRAAMAIRLDDVCTNTTITNIQTFNSCFAVLGTFAFGCSLKNVMIDGVWFGGMKTDSQRGMVDGYVAPTVVRLPKTVGDVTVKNLTTDGLDYLVTAGEELNVTFENCNMQNVENVTNNLGQTKITIDGEEYKGE